MHEKSQTSFPLNQYFDLWPKNLTFPKMSMISTRYFEQLLGVVGICVRKNAMYHSFLSARS